MAKIAVYPGSFDPVTNGHLDIVRRALKLFDRVIVAVLDNPLKKGVFTVAERKAMLAASLKGDKHAEVDAFSGLLVDYMRKRGARTVIRGLRVVSDLDYEFQMASMNSRLFPAGETVFLMPDERYTYLSSSIVREVARMGGDVGGLVPVPVVRALASKFSHPLAS
jgi:pantetheine-phosphate adenylyltransferase